MPNAVILELPRIGPLQRFHWRWQDCVLTAAWPFALAALVPGLSLVSIGVTVRFGSGWLKLTLVALLVAIAVPAVFFALGTRRSLNTEGWIHLSVMPGRAEELAFRGAIQSPLDRTFGRPWRVFGAPCGWGLVITAILLAGFNGFVVVNGFSARLALPAAIARLLSSPVSGWVREGAEDVWPCVLGHNQSNLVIPLASLLK